MVDIHSFFLKQLLHGVMEFQSTGSSNDTIIIIPCFRSGSYMIGWSVFLLL